ncbi:MAG: universal stress protein [Acidimicrobiales bacterium]
MAESSSPPAAEVGDHTGSVIVGVDGSSGSETALRWALDRVDDYGPVVPVHAWDYPAWTYTPAALGGGIAPSSEEMMTSTRSGIGEYLEAIDPTLVDQLVVRWGSASTVLVEEAASSEMLIIGTRGHGAVASRLLGSVSLWCAHHAAVPVAIVPDGALTDRDSERIAVGVDGSPNSEDALRWALRHHQGRQLSVYGAWQSALVFGYEPSVVDPAKVAKASTRLVEDAITRVCQDEGLSADDIKIVMSNESPGYALHHASDENDLLIIGGRSRTGFEYALLGSTSTGLIVKPHCATIVVPHDESHTIVEEH